MRCIFASTSRDRAAVARRAHNPKVTGSIPVLATEAVRNGCFFSFLTIISAAVGLGSDQVENRYYTKVVQLNNAFSAKLFYSA